MEVIHSACQCGKTLCFRYKLCFGGGYWVRGVTFFCHQYISYMQVFLTGVFLFCCAEDKGCTIYYLYINMDFTQNDANILRGLYSSVLEITEFNFIYIILI